MTNPYTKVPVQAVELDNVTYAAFLVAQALPPKDNDWTILQGSYHPGVGVSGGTHDGGGAIDVSPFNWRQRVRALRKVGFAAWHRTPIPGVWGEHIHCILVGNERMSPEAAAQIPDYVNYLDGLASHAPDNTWHPFPKGGIPPVFQYDAYVAETKRVAALSDCLTKAKAQLVRAHPNAQNDAQAKALAQQMRQLNHMHSEFRYRADLYVKEH